LEEREAGERTNVETREKKCRRQRIREHQGEENRGEEGMEFSKDLYVITENCKGLFVKQNFPLI
jgi:hypothetical protein